jgi:hypothetical protein
MPISPKQWLPADSGRDAGLAELIVAQCGRRRLRLNVIRSKARRWDVW